MASAKKQKNGRYQRSVKIGVDGDGKPIRKFFTATTLRRWMLWWRSSSDNRSRVWTWRTWI